MRFRIVPSAIYELKKSVKKALGNALVNEMKVNLDDVIDFDEVCEQVCSFLFAFLPKQVDLPNLQCRTLFSFTFLRVFFFYQTVAFLRDAEFPQRSSVISGSVLDLSVWSVFDLSKSPRLLRLKSSFQLSSGFFQFLNSS